MRRSEKLASLLLILVPLLGGVAAWLGTFKP